MKVPFFRAKDVDSDRWVEGFYVEFPEHSNLNSQCRLIHTIITVVPDMSVFPVIRNTLNFCTIDIFTLEQIGEVEIGEEFYNPGTYIKQPKSKIIL